MAAGAITREAKTARRRAHRVCAVAPNAIDSRAAPMFRKMAAGLERCQNRLVTRAAHRQYFIAGGLSDEAARMSGRFIGGGPIAPVARRARLSSPPVRAVLE